jgi:succinate dehydrogenase/fumarate reductase flavoprotein subunit
MDPLAAHNPNVSPWWEVVLDGFGSTGGPPRPSAFNATDQASFDVIVAGSGAAGLTAAIFAQEKGSSVLVLDAATDGGGGTTYKSGAGMWVPDNSIMRARGLEPDRDWAVHHMAKLAFPDRYEPEAEHLGLDERDLDLIHTYYDTAGNVMDELQRVGLGLMEFPSMTGQFEAMVEYHDDIEHGYGTHLSPRQKDGRWGVGFHMIAGLAEIAQRLGVELRLGHRVVDVLQDDGGRVIGVAAETPDGPVTLSASQGVVFATGGYVYNQELTDRHFPGGLYSSCAVETGRGDFIEIGARVGAEIGNMGEGWGTEHPLEMQLDPDYEITSHIGAAAGDSLIMVNAAGHRVVNEKQIYHERSKVHFVRDEDGNLPNHLLFLVYDEFVARDKSFTIHRWPDPDPVNPWVIVGETFEELAAAIDVRLARYADQTGVSQLEPNFVPELEKTVERFNGFARNGKDEDFQRGETRALELEWTGPWHAVNDKNPCMWPLADEGPYYAIIVAGSVLDTNGGPRVNTRAQVVAPDGTPIPGLYGAGNCIASLAGAGYWSGGSTLGPATTFGWLAAQNVAAEPRAELPDPAVRAGRGRAG